MACRELAPGPCMTGPGTESAPPEPGSRAEASERDLLTPEAYFLSISAARTVKVLQGI